MEKFTLTILLVLVAFFGAFANSQANEEEIIEFMRERDREIKALVGPKGTDHTEDQKEELKDMINDVMDYGAMAEYALQDTYDNLTPEQREEFIEIFSSIVRDQSLNSLDIYRADVEYQNITRDGEKVFVETTAILDEVRTPVTYELVRDENSWMITDMSIDNVSTAESYRRSFQNIIRRRGYDALLSSLKRRAEA
jgi:phospholipid transport system substrate-binding protein